MKCPSCQHENLEGSNFCANCGTPLRGTPADTKVIQAVPDEGVDQELSTDEVAAVASLPPESSLLIVLRGPDEGARFLLNQPEVTAGRHPDCDIFLDDITVSRHHAKFVRRDGYTWVEDQQSLNGTYVNRALIDGPVALRRGDEVQIGKYRLVYFTGPSGQA